MTVSAGTRLGPYEIVAAIGAGGMVEVYKARDTRLDRAVWSRDGRYGATAFVRPYDVTADGKRFLMVKQRDRAPVFVSHVILVQNWLEELKARVPAK
jgi:hypothetical protein